MDGGHYPETETLFDDLCFAEKFAVWAVRAWVASHKGQPALTQTIRETFAACGADGGERDLDAVLSLVTTSARRGIDVRCGRCARVSDDERLFLEVVHILQSADDPGRAAFWVADWVTDAATMRVVSAFAGLARILLDAELEIPAQRNLAPAAVPLGERAPPGRLH